MSVELERFHGILIMTHIFIHEEIGGTISDSQHGSLRVPEIFLNEPGVGPRKIGELWNVCIFFPNGVKS